MNECLEFSQPDASSASMYEEAEMLEELASHIRRAMDQKLLPRTWLTARGVLYVLTHRAADLRRRAEAIPPERGLYV